jgi:hypothetical protein
MLYGLTQEFHKEQGQQNGLKGGRSFGGAHAHSGERVRTVSLIALCTAALVGCGGGGSGGSADDLALATGVRTTAPGQLRHQDRTDNTETVVSPTPTSPTTTTPTTTTPTTTTGLPPIGVNIEGLVDWARLSPFVDLMKTARPWGSPDTPWIATTQVDSLGWPTGDAGVFVKVQTVDPGDEGSAYAYIKPGTYKLRFTGRATVAAAASNGVSVSNYLYDSATNRSTADVVVGSGATQMMLTFRNTSGGVRDVSLRQPGYADNQTFTNEFVQAVAPFGVLRFMDYLATNGTPVRTWAERTTPASATQAGSKGGAYEHAIQMANELGKDMWINIPVFADDAYVRSLAELLKQTLASDRVVYVEYSNELWNGVFPQTADNRNAAVAEALAGDTTLTKGTTCTQAMFDASTGDCNQWWAGYFRIGKRVARISTIFSEVFGAGSLNTRFRPVFATQFVNSAIAEQVLKNMATYRGKPSSLIYGVAGAPYFTITPELANSTTATSDQILTALQTSLDQDFLPTFRTGTAYTGGDWTRATHKALADYYGIKSMAYEGGPDLLQSSANIPVKVQANRTTRMGDLVKSQLAQWYGCGNDLFVYYNLTTAWNQHGYWGLTNNAGDLNSPKYAAARAISQTARTGLTCR